MLTATTFLSSILYHLDVYIQVLATFSVLSYSIITPVVAPKITYNKILSQIILHSSYQLMPCSKAVTFPCSIETMNRETYPHPSIHPLLLNPRKTELTKFYCLRFLKLLEGSNERVLSAFNQSLQSLPFPHPLGSGTKPEEPEDNLSD